MNKNLYIIGGCDGTQAKGYTVRLLFFWLNSPELALQQIAERAPVMQTGFPEEKVRNEGFFWRFLRYSHYFFVNLPHIRHCAEYCLPLLPNGELTIILIDDNGNIFGV